MTRLRIVTDSTADIPDELIEELEIGIIHDYINFGTQSLRDRLDISRAEFYSRLATESAVPTSASPGVGEFEAAYRKAGAPEVAVISLHPPAQLSALYNTATLAARSFPDGCVTVLDTGQVSMGLGWQVIAAARACQANKSVAEIVQLVETMGPRVRVFAALDTLEFLRRGGRVGWTQAMVGALLRIKPLIELAEGQILLADRVRTSRRAIDRLVELTEALEPQESLAILHSHWPSGAAELQSRLNHLRPRDQVFVVDVTPTIGVHVGPKGIGVAVVSAAISSSPECSQSS